ncbi:hypothetical protein OW763_02435 [Clostridium aestuarii]|uniref:Twitching motility protein PilT n=1 Tax=Clostridium aestuarii TaxID=338193 RepID=A0ABT4CW33_9CLOT|nr:hypothetical protein [Clostridium aestuarii]MCY6483212.1 hypothetical protein [Clostridium aestuarii]
MLHVFCDKKGAGKTKFLIKSANEKAKISKGNIVYIDDDSRPMFELDRKIRFISTEEFNLKNYSSFYGFLCGILSEDYDITTMYIDGLFNIIDGDLRDAAYLFFDIEKLIKNRGIDIYLGISEGKEAVPDFVKKYVA